MENGDQPKKRQDTKSRLKVLDEERAAPLTAEQRKRLPEQLKGLSEGAQKARQFPLMDGGSEPCFVFHPLRVSRPSSASSKRKSRTNG